MQPYLLGQVSTALSFGCKGQGVFGAPFLLGNFYERAREIYSGLTLLSRYFVLLFTIVVFRCFSEYINRERDSDATCRWGARIGSKDTKSPILVPFVGPPGFILLVAPISSRNNFEVSAVDRLCFSDGKRLPQATKK